MNVRRTMIAMVSAAWLGCGGDDGGDDAAETAADTGSATAATATTTMSGSDTLTTTDATATTTATTTVTTTDSVGDSSESSSSDGGDDTTTDDGGSTTEAAVTASSELAPKSGSAAMGTAVFTVNDRGMVDLVVELTGVEPAGTHALHIHEFPDCSAEDGTSTGMHWNPVGTMLGELGTVEIAEDGTGTFMKTDAWSIGTGMDNDVVNHSMIIHADPDGGTRIACGVIAQD